MSWKNPTDTASREGSNVFTNARSMKWCVPHVSLKTIEESMNVLLDSTMPGVWCVLEDTMATFNGA